MACATYATGLIHVEPGAVVASHTHTNHLRTEKQTLAIAFSRLPSQAVLTSFDENPELDNVN
jgi:hypothetical protein